MAQYDVYGIGNALLDLEYDITPSFLHHHNIDKGMMTLVSEERQKHLLDALGKEHLLKVAPGGSALNTMVTLQQFGAKGYASYKVADDDNGNCYFEAMKQAGLHSNFDHYPRPTGVTGTCLVMITADADRTMNTHLGITETLSVEQLNHDALAKSKYLYMEGYPVTSNTAMEALLTAKHLAEQAGVKTALTLSDPMIVKYFKAQFQQLLSRGIDLLFCNEEEALEFTGAHLLDAAKDALKNVARQFVITRGSKGSVIFDGQQFIELPCAPAKPISTLGAGDTYAGAFLYAITHGYSMKQAGQLAGIAAAAVVSQYGPRLSQAQTDQILKQFKKIN
jgi:sugar/nucleoside kinase (ribokinase family)